jgi:hypothetical protein
MGNGPQGIATELLQTLIRNECVNDGTPESSSEFRNAEVLAGFLEGATSESATFSPLEGRTSVVARIEGSDPSAPSLCLMGHTDVVPVNPDGWSRDPFGGELIDGEVWGRGAIDMLNMTATMAVAFRQLASNGWRPKGTLIYFGVADEEAGGTHGAKWMADNHWEQSELTMSSPKWAGFHLGAPIPDACRSTSPRRGQPGDVFVSPERRPRVDAVRERQRRREGRRSDPQTLELPGGLSDQ